MHPYVHYGIICNSQDMGITCVFMDRLMDKEDTHTHTHTLTHTHTQWNTIQPQKRMKSFHLQQHE